MDISRRVGGRYGGRFAALEDSLRLWALDFDLGFGWDKVAGKGKPQAADALSELWKDFVANDFSRFRLVIGSLFEQEHAVLVGSDNVQQAVAVHILDDELRADTGGFINDVPDPSCALASLVQLVADDPRGLLGTGINAGWMGPLTLAGDQVRGL